MKKSFELESDFYRFYIQGKELFKENNEELNFFNRDLDINPQQYNHLNTTGILKVFTFKVEDELVGYSLFMVYPHSHHMNMRAATQDALFITKKYRGLGSSFIQWCDNELKEMGVEVILRQVTVFNDWSLLLKRLHYKEIETVYMKELKE